MAGKFEYDEDTEWLEKYYKQVVGLAALADCNSESLDSSWLAMLHGLEALAELMKEDLDARKSEVRG